MNYAETMTYWYLRLNGFFPLTRFVLHDYREDRRFSADCDLLGIRPPYVHEDIGGQTDDWDRALFQVVGLEEADTAAVIVEAKGGRDVGDAAAAFTAERLKYAVKRIGLFPPVRVDEIVKRLLGDASYRSDKILIVKVLAAHALDGNPILANGRCEVPLSHIDKFIRGRLRAYRDRKIASRVFFPSDLLQYLIWREEVDSPEG